MTTDVNRILEWKSKKVPNEIIKSLAESANGLALENLLLLIMLKQM